MEQILRSKTSGETIMLNSVLFMAVTLLIAFWGCGCKANEPAGNQLAVFAPVSFSMNGVDFDANVRNSGVPDENEIVGTASSKFGISLVWLHASLIPDNFDAEDHGEGNREKNAYCKSYGAASSPSNPRGEVSTVLKIPDKLSNIRCIDLMIEVRLNSGENLCCNVKVFNMIGPI